MAVKLELGSNTWSTMCTTELHTRRSGVTTVALVALPMNVTETCISRSQVSETTPSPTRLEHRDMCKPNKAEHDGPELRLESGVIVSMALPYRGGRGVGFGNGEVVTREGGGQAFPVDELRLRHGGVGDDMIQENAARAVITVAGPASTTMQHHRLRSSWRRQNPIIIIIRIAK